MRKPQLDQYIFLPAVLVITSIIIALSLEPDLSRFWAYRAFKWITYYFGPLIEWVPMIGIIWLLGLALSRYGKVKMGGVYDEPEFRLTTWVFIIFTSGTTAATMYWGLVEPVYYLSQPPWGLEPGSSAAAGWALSYSIFHRSFCGWAIYCLPALAIAYMYHVRKVPFLKASVVCREILGKYADGLLGKIIDFVVLMAIIGGAVTSFGFVLPFMTELVGEIFNIEASNLVSGIIVVLWIVIIGLANYFGLYKGMKKISNLNVWVVFLLLGLILLLGPTLFLISYYGQSFGQMLTHYFQMGTNLDVFEKSSWPQNWTVFYWCWWGAYSLYMGIFIARISKGRTIRQIIIAVILLPTIGSSLFYFVLGGYSVYLETEMAVPLVGILNTMGGGSLAVEVLKHMPFAFVLLPFFFLVAFIQHTTGIQGAAYTMASLATKKIQANEQPPTWHRMLWALLLGSLGFALIRIGGLRIIQSASVLVGVPVMLVIILMTVSFIKAIIHDYESTQKSTSVILNVSTQRYESVYGKQKAEAVYEKILGVEAQEENTKEERADGTDFVEK